MPCDFDSASEADPRITSIVADASAENIEALIARSDPGAPLAQLRCLRARVAPTLEADGPEGRSDIRLLDAAIENLLSHDVT